MKEIALHVLDIAQNSIRAEATHVIIGITENLADNLLTIELIDNGKGMNDELLKGIKNPFVTSRKLRKVGLGIPFLNQLCEECEGKLEITSKPGEGTRLMATMQYDHIDRLPIGDMPSTMTTLILAKPEIRYSYVHYYNQACFTCDTDEIKKVLDGVPIQDLEIIQWIGNYLQENIDKIHQESI